MDASRHELEIGSTPGTFPPSNFKSFYPKADGWYTQDDAGVETKFATAADIVEDAINDGVTDKAPSENAVYDAIQTINTAIAGKQDHDATLDALAAFNTNGILVQTAHDTFAGRTIQQGTGLAVTNGDGVLGDPVIALADTAVVAGSYGSQFVVPSITIDAQGRITFAADNSAINLSTLGAASSARNINAGTGLTGGGDLTTDMTISLANTAVTAGTYGSQFVVPTLTVDAQGRITLASNNSTINLASLGAASSTRAINTGTGLSGGGDLSADRTIILANTAVVAGAYGSQFVVPSFTVDAQGRLIAASNNTIITLASLSGQPLDSTLTALAGFNANGFMVQTAADTFTARSLASGAGISITNTQGILGDPVISSTITQYTDELAQDAIGGALLATASIQPNYNDGANQFSWAVLPGGVDHNLLLNYVANQHVDHTTVSITGASLGGLGGGGTIAASRTLNIDWTNLTALATPTDRVDHGDLLGLYDISALTHKSLSMKDMFSQVRGLINRAYCESDDFIIDSNARLVDVGAGTGASVQAGTYGLGTSANAIGVSQMDTGTTATGRRTLSSGLSSLVTTKSRLRFSTRMAIEQLSSGTQTFFSRCGFIDISAAGDPTNGAFFKYSDGVNGGKWQCVTAQGGTRSTADSGITADTNYHAFTIEINEAGTSVGFYIDGVLVGTITTNIPNGTLAQAFGYGWQIEKTVGITQVNQSIDWYYFESERINAR